MEAREFNRLLKELRWNKKAIEKIYLFYYPRAINHFSAKYGVELAEDATQDFFLKLPEISDKQEYIEYPASWVYKCIENIAKRKVQFDSRWCSLTEAVATVDTADCIEKKELVDSLLAGLNPTEQKIIYLIHWEGYSRKEASVILELSPANVRKIYSRALKKLKKLL